MTIWGESIENIYCVEVFLCLKFCCAGSSSVLCEVSEDLVRFTDRQISDVKSGGDHSCL